MSQKKFPRNILKYINKCSNTSILYTTDALKALLRKNWFYFILSSSDMQNFHQDATL